MSLGGIQIRKGQLEDLEGILSLRAVLAVDGSRADGGQGGFLLGSDPERYRFFIEHSLVEVLRDEEGLQGFSIALSDLVLRQSDIWSRRANVAWSGFDIASIESDSVAYLDQIAVAPGFARRAAGALACRTLDRVFLEHEHMLVTTVIAPWRNDAAIPMLKMIGAERVGEIDEVYPEVGSLRSAVHYLSRKTWMMQNRESALVQRVRRRMERIHVV